MKVANSFFSFEKNTVLFWYFLVGLCGLSFLVPQSKDLVLLFGEMTALALLSVIFWIEIRQNSTKSFKIWIMLNFSMAFLFLVAISKTALIFDGVSFSRFFRFEIVGVPFILIFTWLSMALAVVRFSNIISKIKLFQAVLACLMMFVFALVSCFYLFSAKLVDVNQVVATPFDLAAILILSCATVLSHRWLKVDSPITMFFHWGVLQLILMLVFIGANL